MRRLPAVLMSIVTPAAVVLLPVAAVPGTAPRPVAPVVRELELPAPSAAAPGARSVISTDPRTTEPFTTVGVTWDSGPQDAAVTVELRTRTQEGRWSAWTALEVAGGAQGAEAGSGRAGTDPYWAGPSDGVQVRVDAPAGAAPRDVRLVLVDPGTSPADEGRAEVLGGGSTATAATQRPVIRTRAEWGADESLRRSAPDYNSTIQAVTVHHTASATDYSEEQVPGILRGFYAYHVQGLGWSDIGYNLLVDRFGRTWEGRAGGVDRPVVGAHVGGFNTGTAGIAMLGTFESVAPSAALLESTAQAAAWKLSLHGRDPGTSVVLTSAGSTRYAAGVEVLVPRVNAHRDLSNTADPGTVGYSRMPALRSRAAQLFAQAAVWSPTGSLDQVLGTADGVRVVGWAGDPDGPARTSIEVRVDGALAGTVPADSHRPDVAVVRPALQAYRGFSTVVPAAPGTRSVCLTAVDQGLGADRPLDCRTVTVPAAPAATTGSPQGYLDSVVAGPRSLVVRGWALDEDAASRTEVSITVDGVAAGRLLADQYRPDLATAFPLRSADRGFAGSLPAVAGTRRVCAWALDQGAGEDVRLGCATVQVRPGTSPALARGQERLLRRSLTDGPAELGHRFPGAGTPLVGDWDGDGTRTAGLFRDGVWYLTDDPTGAGTPRTVVFGAPGDRPAVGDWDGDGRTTFGVVRAGRWFTTDDVAALSGVRTWLFGDPSDVPVPGDWDGDGRDTAGVFRLGTWLTSDVPGRTWAERSTSFGNPGDLPVAADWDGDGRVTPGVFRGGQWLLTDVPGRAYAETVLRYGSPGDVPLGW